MYWHLDSKGAQPTLSFGHMKYQELYGCELTALIKGWVDTVGYPYRAQYIIVRRPSCILRPLCASLFILCRPKELRNPNKHMPF